MRRRAREPVPLVAQAIGLDKYWPDGKATIKHRWLRWVGTLRPTAVSPLYTVQLQYHLLLAPEVHVLDPPLDPGHRERLPHVYSGDRLCLYDPLADEWNNKMRLAETIVPWTAEWLLHYEIWKATDRWVGGGDVYAPPDTDLERPMR